MKNVNWINNQFKFRQGQTERQLDKFIFLSIKLIYLISKTIIPETINNYMQKQQILFQAPMGEQFSTTHISQQKRLKEYILITYRSGILPIEPTTYYTSDSGWGCMLRTAQMFIANLIHVQQPQFQIGAIVKLFYDNLMVPFSIQHMTKLSRCLFPYMKPYQWYTPCQAGFLVKSMLEMFDFNYKVKICNDGAMFLEDILAEDDKIGQDKQSQKQSQDQKEKSEQQPTQSHQNKPPIPSQQRIVVLLMARIGLDHSQPPYIRCVSKFISNKYFVSIMGGTPKHAHLIVDYEQGYFGYLDPHTTHSVIPDSARVSDYLSQYVSKPEWLKESKVDSSMCIGFCFMKEETKEFWESMLMLKEQMKEDFFIYMDQKRPQFDQNCIIEIHDIQDQNNES